MEYGQSKSKMSYQSRLASFFSYPYPCAVSVTEMAEAGFHYEGHEDEVNCHNCGLKCSGWQKEDNPKSVHVENFPTCPFFETSECEAKVGVDDSKKGEMPLSGACGGFATEGRRTEDKTHPNINTNSTFITLQKTETNAVVIPHVSEASGLDVTDNSVHGGDTIHSTANSDNFSHRNEVEHCSKTENSAMSETQTVESRDEHTRGDTSDTGNDSMNNSDTITIPDSTETLDTIRPKYQQFAVLANRLDSYRQWPAYLRQRPEVLSKAGLFYEGTNDYVRCFQCAGGLREWEPEDDPFYEHARWFPCCPFMRLTKGDKYIMGVQSGTITPSNVLEKEEIAPRQNLNLLEHPAVLSIMEMGYSKSLITTAITVFKERNGMDLSAEQLLPIVWEAEENDNIVPQIIENENVDRMEAEKRLESKTDVTDQVAKGKDITKDIDKLTEENRILRVQKTCKVCLDEEANIVFLPCGHLVTCPMCASALRKCPMCRTYIRGTVKAIIS
ncbi:baculoviral IAP repeat-containing protein 7-like [Ylistrum balloti]|uniref:baculoviral IAP repeat-containing protein 7-like n=1 Tax=Ylistrum balloti TaxID=509963 RepID=UPI002905A41A|nr:baculoviral IAP repeat-containing protein 7-like [Ylistrum balloti]